MSAHCERASLSSQRLCNICHCRAGAALPAVTNVFTTLSSLVNLESLSIVATSVAAAFELTDIDLAPLVLLPRLHTFQFADQTGSTFSCSAAQVDALAQCALLTNLECGQWMPRWGMRRAGSALSDRELMQIDALARLNCLRHDNGAASLRRLDLGDAPMIFPQCWCVLSRCTALEKIDAHWSSTLTAADWALLATFTRLHTLGIRELECGFSPRYRALLDLGVVLSSLLACRALRVLELEGPFDLHTEHVTLLAQIPSLETFHCSSVHLESLAPLSNAPALTSLTFRACCGLDSSELINIRVMIPPMPLLLSLAIFDEDESRLAPLQAEPFNAALFQRLPKLTPQRFQQLNLLP